MNPTHSDELFAVFSRKDLVEVGGGHNQKGIEFQRHWAIMKMIRLHEQGNTNFLVLFETYQDVAILDSENSPTQIQVFQIKKKDRKDWTWAELTNLENANKAATVRKGRKATKQPGDIQNSPIGKLYAIVRAFKSISGTGYFISNAGCDLPKADGTNAATSGCSPVSSLENSHIELLNNGFKIFHADGGPKLDLSRLFLEKVAIPVDDPGTYLVGVVHNYFLKISPRHAGQARALVDTLLAKIGPLGAKTDSCSNFEEVKRQRGYSSTDLVNAFGNLESLPDLQSYLETWLSQLQIEGMGFMEVTAIRAAATGVFRRQVMGTVSQVEVVVRQEIEAWLVTNPVPQVILPFFRRAYSDLGKAHPEIKEPEFYAHFSLKAIQQCVDLT